MNHLVLNINRISITKKGFIRACKCRSLTYFGPLKYIFHFDSHFPENSFVFCPGEGRHTWISVNMLGFFVYSIFEIQFIVFSRVITVRRCVRLCTHSRLNSLTLGSFFFCYAFSISIRLKGAKFEGADIQQAAVPPNPPAPPYAGVVPLTRGGTVRQAQAAVLAARVLHTRFENSAEWSDSTFFLGKCTLSLWAAEGLVVWASGEGNTPSGL